MTAASMPATLSLALAIPPAHPAFAGHFPGTPIVPGVVLLDEALTAISRAVGLDLSACRIGSVKFLSPVSPGEPISLSCRVASSGAIQFEIASNDRRVAAGSIQAASAT